jgi:hypothetical protein
MGSLHSSVLFHTDIRWFSKKNTDSFSSVQLEIDVEMFLKKMKSNLGEVCECAYWMAKFA